MKRTHLLIAAAAGFLMAKPVLADETTEAKSDADEALAQKADVPAKPPVLPDQASDRARYVHDNIAFGKKGDAERLAHSKAESQGKSDADDAEHDAANRAAHGAATSAAGAANADTHDKAGRDRSNDARNPTQSPTTPSTPRH